MAVQGNETMEVKNMLFSCNTSIQNEERWRKIIYDTDIKRLNSWTYFINFQHMLIEK